MKIAGFPSASNEKSFFREERYCKKSEVGIIIQKFTSGKPFIKRNFGNYRYRDLNSLKY
jgi:hypothetical protein